MSNFATNSRIYFTLLKIICVVGHTTFWGKLTTHHPIVFDEKVSKMFTFNRAEFSSNSIAVIEMIGLWFRRHNQIPMFWCMSGFVSSKCSTFD